MNTLPRDCRNIVGGGHYEAPRCVICFTPFELNTPTTTHLRCPFVACRDCWTEWQVWNTGHLTCPLCRAPLIQFDVQEAKGEVEDVRQQRRGDRHIRLRAACEARARADTAELHYQLRDLPGQALVKVAIQHYIELDMANFRYALMIESIHDEELEEGCAIFERLGLSPASFDHHFPAIIGPADSFDERRAELAEYRAGRDKTFEKELQKFVAAMSRSRSRDTSGRLRSGRAFRQLR